MAYDLYYRYFVSDKFFPELFMPKNPKKIALLDEDPWLAPHEEEIENRLKRFHHALDRIEKYSSTLEHFAGAYEYLGITYDKSAKGWYYREWAPGAQRLYLIGDFNGWDRSSHPLYKNEQGIWEIFLPEKEYKKAFVHESKVKVHVVGDNGAHDRIPAYIRRVVQDPSNFDFAGQLWFPKKEYKWTDEKFKPKAKEAPFIYECHVGMAQETEGVGTYVEFADNILPRIKDLGYNTIQMMAIQEHPYYGSYGYHVSNFFCPSSRFGTPEDLKYLVNKAHEMGIAVIMDVIHSHSVKNFAEGLTEFDGSGHHYFHEGSRGYHELWDSMLFDYGKLEVQQFLLSNLRYWLEEFHFDGFRFDGVTSLLYLHHGQYFTFDNYDTYYNDVDWDALIYLQLANTLVHRLNKNAITISEDMSGMPGMCREPKDGGVGFDYRLGMGLPDYWIKLLKEKRDEDWDIYEMWHVMTNRRYNEKTIAYAESHDQALVGDKTLAFWLMDKEMYFEMNKDSKNLVIERGIALHKMIRLFTMVLGGEAYLTFMGNEFGHPEWVDFPREGNDWSHKHARRQWSLADNKDLQYHYMLDFDREMVKIMKKNNVLNAEPAQQLNMDGSNQCVVFERNNLIFLFNFHAVNAIPDYRFRVFSPGKYKIILNSDDTRFGGHGRIDNNTEFFTVQNYGPDFLSVYMTNRTVLVMERVD